MVDLLERVSDETYRGFFVDLYVRCTNDVAIGMYEELGYSVYRRVREYYDSLGGNRGRDEEDAFGESCFYLLSFSLWTKGVEGKDVLIIFCMADMRKPLSRDAGRRSVRANGRDMHVTRHEVS